MNIKVARLKPKDDLKQQLDKIIKDINVHSGFMVTSVGSLSQITMRMSGAIPEKQDIRTLNGHFEIVSLVGTLSSEGSHLHISISDENGKVTGGHLKEGTLVDTTVEVVIGFDKSIKFNRTLDPITGFKELSIE